MFKLKQALHLLGVSSAVDGQKQKLTGFDLRSEQDLV